MWPWSDQVRKYESGEKQRSAGCNSPAAEALPVKLTPLKHANFGIKMSQLKLALICIHLSYLLTAVWTFSGRQSSHLRETKLPLPLKTGVFSLLRRSCRTLADMPEGGNTNTHVRWVYQPKWRTGQQSVSVLHVAQWHPEVVWLLISFLCYVTRGDFALSHLKLSLDPNCW